MLLVRLTKEANLTNRRWVTADTLPTDCRCLARQRQSVGSVSAVTHLLFVRFASFVRRTSSIWIHDSTLWAFLILDLPVGLQAGAQQIDLMRYMTDASLADMAPELRQKGLIAKRGTN